jgi:deoxyribonucleoside regulator
MTKDSEQARSALLAQVASWYYEDKQGLGVIAKRLNRSVSLISRMLQAAHDAGLVEIRINYPMACDASLEEKLISSFSLRQAHVAVTHGRIHVKGPLRHFGSVAAEALRDALGAKGIVGLSWGTHVYSIVSALRPTKAGQGTVVQVSGAIDAGDPTVDGAQLAQILANKLGKEVRTLHAPLVVESEGTAGALRGSRSIAETLRLAAKADHLLIGVGTPYLPSAGLRRAGCLTDLDLVELKQSDAVGDIAGYHINADGEVLDIGLNRRIIGIHPKAMRKIENVIVAATGDSKVKPILAALRGGYVDTLVTDTETAAGILRVRDNALPRRQTRRAV